MSRVHSGGSTASIIGCSSAIPPASRRLRGSIEPAGQSTATMRHVHHASQSALSSVAVRERSRQAARAHELPPPAAPLAPSRAGSMSSGMHSAAVSMLK